MQNRSAVYRLLAANFISGLAQGMSMLAIPIYFAESGQSAWFGFAYMCMTMVTLFWAPYAGTLVDRYDRRRIFLLLNLVNGSILGSLALAAWHFGLSPWMAAAAFATTFWNYSLHYPSFYAFLQEVSEREHYGRIASMIEVQGQMASAMAGASAAVLLKGLTWGDWLIPAVPLHLILGLDALTYFIAFILIFSMRYQSLIERRPDMGSLLERFRTGFNYLRSVPAIFLLGCITYGVFITIMVHVIDLSPAYVHQHLQVGGHVFALSEMCYAFGAIASGLFVQKLFRRLHPVLGIILFSSAGACWYFLLTLNSQVFWFYLLSVALGITNAGVRVLRVSYLMTVIPNHVWGRATSIFGLFNTLCRAAFLGLFSIPFFDQTGNLLYSYYILSIFLLLITALLMLRYRHFVPKT